MACGNYSQSKCLCYILICLFKIIFKFSNSVFKYGSNQQIDKEVKEKDIKNSKFEIEQNELQEDVRQTEKCIGQKIKILRTHLEEKEKYGTKLQQNIETIHKERKQLSEE